MAKISQIQLPNGDTFDLVDEKVTQNASTSNTPQPILFRNNVSTSANNSTEQVRYASAVTVTPSTGTINATKFNDYILAGACAKAVDNSISTSSSSTNLPTSAAVASFVEGKGYITSYTETDPVFSASAAAGITATDISNWNSKISDDKTWNGVELEKIGTTYGPSSFIPGRSSTSATTAYQIEATTTPGSYKIVKWDNNKYLYSTTPSANDNSTKVATTAYVDSAVGGISVPTKTSDLTNDSGFVTTDEKVKTINAGNNTNYYLVMGSLTGTETKMASMGLYYKANSSDHISTLTIGYPMASGHLTGNIVLAKDNNYNTTIVPSTTGTHNTLTLPNSTGTLALTSDIPPIPLIPTDLSDLNNDLNVSDFPNDAGYITGYTETDPIFTASAAYGISASDITNWNGKQAALVSGINIKTINNQSLLGSGNLTIGGTQAQIIRWTEVVGE